MASSIRRVTRLAFAALSYACAPSARAQVAIPAAPDRFASVTGVVAIPGPTAQLPVAGVMVTVHRVGSDSSGALDSVRTDAAGRYSLTFRKFGDESAVYFASALYRGIAYFSSPLRSARASGEEAGIVVFDTTSRRMQFAVQGHHVVISAPRPDGQRDVVEVWELSNDTTVTVVGRDSLSAVWSTKLPRGAKGFAGGPGDVAPASLEVRGDSAMLFAAFGPGVKQISYTYQLPPSSFPLVVPVTRRTSVLEVLIEEVAGQASGVSLKSMDAANTQGRIFKRWLAQDVAAGEVVRITVPTTSAALRTRLLAGLAAVIVVAMGFALFRALRRRTSAEPAVTPGTDRERLVAGIAALDARKERGDASLTEAEYATERGALKAQLAALLAAETRRV